jgi:mono/diheme cytochrome c family protein
MNRVRIALFNDRAAAEPIQQRLLIEGIPAEIHDAPWLAKFWFVSALSGGVRIEVPARLSEKAIQLLLIWDAEEGALRAAISCPECHSLRVEYPQVTQHFIFPNLVIGLLAGLGLVEKDYYCEACHYMWPKPRAKAQRVRARLAPNYFNERFPQTDFPVTAKAHPAGLSARESLKQPPANGDRQAIQPARYHLLRFWRRPLSKAVLLGGVMLLLGGGDGLAKSADAGVTADGSAKTKLEGTIADRKQVAAHSETPTYLRDVLPILMGKCARCHSEESPMLHNWLDYQIAFSDRWEIRRRVWHSWKGTYFKQPMPAGNGPEAQAMTEEERAIIRDWVKNGAPRGVQPTYSDLQPKAEKTELGRRLFGTICAACHQPTGQGIPSRFPPLAGSDFLNADKHRAIKVVVNGLQGEVVVNGQKFNSSMPRFPLGDQDIANVLTYVYSSFGNSGKEVAPQEVSAVRLEKDEPAVNEANPTVASQEKSPYE